VRPPVWVRAGPQLPLCALVLGVSLADAERVGWAGVVAVVVIAVVVIASGSGVKRAAVRRGSLCLALVAGGWGWGSARLDALDRSVLLPLVDTSERARLVVTAPARYGRYEVRVPVDVRRFGRLELREPALLVLPSGRGPPQGTIVEAVATARLPRSDDQFDERTWLRRHGVHVVLHADSWSALGRRGGLAGLADRLRGRLTDSAAPGLQGERRALVEGVVLGDDQGVSEQLRDRFRASGLYHLLAVSGQNVALVAGSMLGLAWLLAAPRWLGELGALGGITAYVLAVGPQPSVVRAGITGALGSLAWLAARPRDRWHFLLVGAAALLVWNPYTLLDPGFQLSFSAVIAIFLLAPRIDERLHGYPLPAPLRTIVAVSTACGLATAPILWLQFHAVPLLSVPANALASPAIVPVLGLGLGAAALTPLSPDVAAALAWANGWCVAYLAACARIVGGLPLAQVRSGKWLLVLAALVLAVAAYAWRRWRI
jgi:competence protein ComEC